MAKCKVCGSRVNDGVEKCPMCGNFVSGVTPPSQTNNVKQSAPKVQQPQPSVTSATTKIKCKVCGSKIDNGLAKCPMCGNVVFGANQASGSNISTATETNNSYSVQKTPAPQNSVPKNSAPQKPAPKKPVPQSYNYDDDEEDDYDEDYDGRDATDDELEDAYITGETIPAMRNSSYFHYKEAFKKIEQGKNPGWSWGAFFGRNYILFYRKLYFRAAVFSIFNLLISAYVIFFQNKKKKGMFVSVAADAGLGAFTALSNDRAIYKRYKRIATNARIQFPDSAYEQIEYVAKRGGTNIFAVLIYLGIVVAFAIWIFCWFSNLWHSLIGG